MRRPCLMFAAAACAAIVVPAHAQNEKVYFGILHSHTSYSDGSGLPEEAYAQAREQAHCDFFAITEHNHNTDGGIRPKEPRVGMPPIAGDHALYNGPAVAGQPRSLVEAARAANQDGVFVAIYGQEFSTISSGNHVNVFDVPEVIDAESGRFDELLAWIRQPAHFDTSGRVAIVQLNHPSLTLRSQGVEYGQDDFPNSQAWLNALNGVACTIEVLNGPGTKPGPHEPVPSSDESAYRFYLSAGLHVAPTADQDNHFRTWGTLTTVRTGVIADALTKASILGAIRARHVYATSDENLRVIARVNGHLAGDMIAPPAPGSELAITISLDDADEPTAKYRIEVYKGEPGSLHDTPSPEDVANVTGNGTFTIEDVAYDSGSRYYWFKVIQKNADGHEDHAWTAPIWMDPTASEDPPESGPDEAIIVASKKSGVYHTNPNCPSAKTIKPANRITGAAAREGRQPHDCPAPE